MHMVIDDTMSLCYTVVGNDNFALHLIIIYTHIHILYMCVFSHNISPPLNIHMWSWEDINNTHSMDVHACHNKLLQSCGKNIKSLYRRIKITQIHRLVHLLKKQFYILQAVLEQDCVYHLLQRHHSSKPWLVYQSHCFWDEVRTTTTTQASMCVFDH